MLVGGWVRASGNLCGSVDPSGSSVAAVRSLRGGRMHLVVLRSRLPPPCLSGTETLLGSQGRGQEDLQCRPEPVSVWSPRGPQL